MDKIIVEFSRKELKKMCPLTDWCRTCKKEDERLIECHLNRADYKIKEQKNGNKN